MDYWFYCANWFYCNIIFMDNMKHYSDSDSKKSSVFLSYVFYYFVDEQRIFILWLITKKCLKCSTVWRANCNKEKKQIFIEISCRYHFLQYSPYWKDIRIWVEYVFVCLCHRKPYYLMRLTNRYQLIYMHWDFGMKKKNKDRRKNTYKIHTDRWSSAITTSNAYHICHHFLVPSQQA